MRINKLVLDGLTTHEGEWEIGDGITGIIGPCGVGKSNLKRCLKFLLTNIVEERSTAELINYNLDKGFGAVEASLGTDEILIQRWLNATSADKIEAKIGNRVCDRINETYDELYGRIGASKELVAEIALAEQGSIGSFLFDKASQRKAKLQSLLGLNGIQSSYNLVTQELSSINITDYSEEKKNEEGRVKELRGTIKKLQKEMSEITAKQEDVDSLVGKVSSMQQIQAAFKEAKKNLPGCAEKLKGLKSDLEKIEKNKKDLKNWLTNAKEGYIEAKKTVEAFDGQEEYRSKWLNLRAKIKDAKETIQKHTTIFTKGEFEKISNDCQEKINSLQRKLSAAENQKLSLRDEIKGMEVFLSATGKADDLNLIFGPFEKADSERCYVCGTKFENAEGSVSVEEYNRRIPLFEETDNLINSFRSEIETLQNTYDIFNLEGRSPANILIESASELDKLKKEVDFISRDQKDKAQEVVEVFEKTKLQFTEIKSKPDEIVTKIKAIEEKKVQYEKDIENNIDDEKYIALKCKLENLRSKVNKKIELSTQISGLEKNIVECDKNIKSFDEKIKAAEKDRKYKTILEDVKRMSHRDVIPAKCMSKTISTINKIFIAKQREIGLDVEVYLDEEDFEPKVISNRFRGVAGKNFLSGGQKTAVSISFILAVWDLLLPNFNIMVLDEPTAYLNDEYVESLVDVLNRVKAGLGNKQIILISHNPRLRESVMDNVINLAD